MTDETPTVSTPELAETLGLRVESLRGWRHRGLTPRAGRRWDLNAGLRAVLIHRLSEHFAPLEVAAEAAKRVSTIIYDDVNEGRPDNGVVGIVNYPSGNRGIFIGNASANTSDDAWGGLLQAINDERRRHNAESLLVVDLRHDLQAVINLFGAR